LQRELDQLQKRGYCYGAGVNLLTLELQNQTGSYSYSALLNDISKSQNRTIFYEEVELLRAKIEEALFLNQNQEPTLKILRKQLKQQKKLLPPFKTIGEAEKGDYLNFEEISKEIQSKSTQEAFIIHGESEKRAHAIGIVQNSRTGRFYFFDWTGIPLCGARMYAFNSASELQQALASYLTSHYSDLTDSTSKWRLQQINLNQAFQS
ncbi:MAG: hypothetical protein H0U49_11895, partial [Parachlamydiaceae bacterium]|nr:hypothetical protein [Parachlamydiaceae bacterium]